jgi:hypothetical protein
VALFGLSVAAAGQAFGVDVVDSMGCKVVGRIDLGVGDLLG